MRRSLIAGASVLAAGVAWFVVADRMAEAETIRLRPDSPDVVTQGAEIYAAACASCHGVDLEGQPNWRSRNADGRLPAPPHDETGHTWHHDATALFQLTKVGVAEMIGDPGYASDMPAFADTLSDAEIVAVLSYIKSTWPADIRARHDGL
ncbi:cytochrome c [Salipiger sp. IMCC34102]|uniref:c-type cytochrome n=1 Tax=Salipiger sp. IMCC34102 TaxID=2510647 RepID=UPI00101DA3B2|nr:cytochrome c [Salipiger sp. IMCC34102]RYH00887.1 cytochrome c [Salipiger sp. IMCC34102]